MEEQEAASSETVEETEARVVDMEEGKATAEGVAMGERAVDSRRNQPTSGTPICTPRTPWDGAVRNTRTRESRKTATSGNLVLRERRRSCFLTANTCIRIT